MNARTLICTELTALALLLAAGSPARADGSVKFEGRIRLGGTSPQPGQLFDIQFRLFDVPAGGTQLTSVLAQVSVADSNGLFQILIPLSPSNFDSSPRWLE